MSAVEFEIDFEFDNDGEPEEVSSTTLTRLLPPGPAEQSRPRCTERADPRLALLLRRADQSVEPVMLRPGGRLFVGRHPCNDIVLPHSSVSRFHAVVAWEVDAARPVLRDRGSSNGTTVRGRPVLGPVHLHGEEQIRFGTQPLLVELLHDGVPAPALLPTETEEEVVFLFEPRGGFRCQSRSRESLLRTLLDLEVGARTGTVEIGQGAFTATLTYCRGLIVSAKAGPLAGADVVKQILSLSDGVVVSFRRPFVPVEAQLSISVEKLLIEHCQTTSRVLRLSNSDLESDVSRGRAPTWPDEIAATDVGEISAAEILELELEPTGDTLWRLGSGGAWGVAA